MYLFSCFCNRRVHLPMSSNYCTCACTLLKSEFSIVMFSVGSRLFVSRECYQTTNTEISSLN